MPAKLFAQPESYHFCGAVDFIGGKGYNMHIKMGCGNYAACIYMGGICPLALEAGAEIAVVLGAVNGFFVSGRWKIPARRSL